MQLLKLLMRIICNFLSQTLTAQWRSLRRLALRRGLTEQVTRVLQVITSILERRWRRRYRRQIIVRQHLWGLTYLRQVLRAWLISRLELTLLCEEHLVVQINGQGTLALRHQVAVAHSLHLHHRRLVRKPRFALQVSLRCVQQRSLVRVLVGRRYHVLAASLGCWLPVPVARRTYVPTQRGVASWIPQIYVHIWAHCVLFR